MQISVAIADDHPLVLAGLRGIFAEHPVITVRGCCHSGRELLQFLEKNTVDVLLLDIHMKGMQGDEVALAVRELYPEMLVVALTNIDQPFTVRTMLQAGVRGYLLKGADRDLLCHVITQVKQGQYYIDETIAQNLLAESGDGMDAPRFTERELAVLEMIAREHTSREIAAALYISVSRVEVCRMDLFLKLGVKNVAGLVRKAIHLGLIQ